MNAKILPLLIMMGCLLASLTGCVERELTITSEPAGALVWISNVEVGRTPLTVPFTWYGDYDVVLRLYEPPSEENPQGQYYQTLKTNTRIIPPLYDVPPFDFISQTLVPWTYRYRVYRHFELQPMDLPSDEELIDNALILQQRNLEQVR